MVNIQYKNVYKTEVIDMEKLSEGLKENTTCRHWNSCSDSRKVKRCVG